MHSNIFLDFPFKQAVNGSVQKITENRYKYPS